MIFVFFVSSLILLKFSSGMRGCMARRKLTPRSPEPLKVGSWNTGNVEHPCLPVPYLGADRKRR
jgi:hypothetical protein